ncbi:MAG: excinuclease ABC subunit UvrC [Alphaproteobacteria bacterium]|jgi:excinuclease ABC subunit C|nr:excinuclease ABC subunit UvrC [Alphaproteobacteria bacterium]
MAKRQTAQSNDGLHYLKAELARLPTSPGVYRMLNEAGAVLYVGKARNLKARVTQYTQPTRLPVRIRKMVFETRQLITVQTHTEAEALLLEANLIKSLKPKYNITLRDDSSYVSVVITGDETPLIRSHRGPKREKAKGDSYYGPYPSAGAVYQTLDFMERVFKLRTCSDSTFAHRTRPCLKYDLKRCSAPCVRYITPEAYQQDVKAAKQFLQGERAAVLATLQAQMNDHATAMRYEAAAAVRDRIKAISQLTEASGAVTHVVPEGDVFALVTQGGKACVQAFYYRNGQHVGNHQFWPTYAAEQESDAELLRVFLALHYANRPAPVRILTNLEPADSAMLAEALSTTSGRSVKLETPTRGEKAEIVARAATNATAALQRKLTESGTWQHQLAELAKLLGSPPITRLECTDISNLSGKHAVASQVCAGAEGMEKNRYRKYKIQTKDTPDDYAMLREVYTRRFTRMAQEDPAEWPQVLLVDGGKGQLNVLVECAQAAALWGQPHAPQLVGVAKGEERDKGLETFWHATPAGVVQLPIAYNSPLIFVLQRIRDEAHRFAISFHRNQRATALSASRLDDIPGVGPTKKRALLQHFGSVAAVRGASLSQLEDVPGLGKALAKVVFDYFQA